MRASPVARGGAPSPYAASHGSSSPAHRRRTAFCAAWVAFSCRNVANGSTRSAGAGAGSIGHNSGASGRDRSIMRGCSASRAAWQARGQAAKWGG